MATLPASINFPAIRVGICRIIGQIPEIKRVEPYWVKGLSPLDAPFSVLYRETILGPGLSVEAEGVGDEGLGQYSHLVMWRIEIYAKITSQGDAQEKDDLYAARLLDVFNAPAARLIDPNGPGVVDNSRLLSIDPFEELEQSMLWVTTANLQTKIISTR